MTRSKSLFIIIFLLLSLVATVTLSLRTTSFFGRATTDNTSPVILENSYLFASPLQAKADSKEQIRITVFLLDSRGLGVPHQSVILRNLGILNPLNSQSITDDSGKAFFDLASPSPGSYTIEAENLGRLLPQKIKITYY